jgi:WD40 repeat protein
VQTFPGDGQAVGAIALSPDGSRALSTRSDGSVQSWDLPKPPPPANQLLVMAGNGPVTCVAFSPDGAFAVGNIRDDLCLWNATDGSQVRTYPIQTPIASAAFSTDGRTIVYGTGAKNGKFGNVALREVVSRRGGREERRFQGHLGQVAAVAITPDAQRAVSASADGTVRVWDVPLEKETHKLELGLPIVCVALTKGENEVLIGANDTSLRLWKWDAGQEVTRLDGHASAVLSVAVSADGKRAASASADRTVCVWDLPGKQRIAQLEGHSGPVNSVAISQHGLTVLSGSDDGTVRLWDVQTAKEVLRFEGHTGPVRCVAMSADGMRAISGGEDATLRVWKLPIRVQ